ncbi:MAG TPA: S41 family peptidase [Gaiellales bacterium]|jgi:carboxyl-terminal processing protease|nr:S41 family peptidase [Gaiellales bacterium]
MRPRRTIAVVAAVVLAFALGYATRRGGEHPAPAPVAAPRPVLADAVRQVLAQRYVRALDPGALASARTVPQLISQLRDPFTSYLTAAEYAALRADTAQGFYGIGVRVRAQGKALLRIVSVVPRSPASRAGLHGGDLLVAVDGLRVRGHMDTALAALQAPHRGALRLVMRVGSKQRVVAVRRGIVTQPAVVVHDVAKGKVRVIRITRFSHGVARDVRLAARHAPVVVLDLRGNPGGLISEARDTVDVFLDHGRILSYSGAHTIGKVVNANQSALPRMPLVVVVDRATASAAEIVAAALGENKRAKIVGTRTFGKATIQAVVPVPGGGAVKLTVAEYLTPNGRSLHGRGVLPDVTVKTRLLVKAVALARNLRHRPL